MVLYHSGCRDISRSKPAKVMLTPKSTTPGAAHLCMAWVCATSPVLSWAVDRRKKKEARPIQIAKYARKRTTKKVVSR
jgi:hypothetical protein